MADSGNNQISPNDKFFAHKKKLFYSEVELKIGK